MSEPTNADKNQAVGLLEEATKLVIQARRLLQEPPETHLSNVVLMLALRSEEVSMDLLGYGA